MSKFLTKNSNRDNMSKNFCEKKVIVQYVKYFLQKKIHGIVCRNFWPKKVILQYGEIFYEKKVKVIVWRNLLQKKVIV